REVDEAIREKYNIDDVQGLYVFDVVEGGAAASSGIKQGDIITKVEGRPVISSSDLQERVARLSPGDKVKITYKRDGKEKDVTLTLKGQEAKKKAEEAGSNKSGTEIFNKLGASFKAATDAQKKQYGISSGVV